MYINFSRVVVSVDGRGAEIFVPNLVKGCEDLSGYKKFEEFVSIITEECIVDADITIYGCDTEKAEIDGFASLLIRLARDYRFILQYCDELSHTGFKFAWSPSLQSGVDL